MLFFCFVADFLIQRVHLRIGQAAFNLGVFKQRMGETSRGCKSHLNRNSNYSNYIWWITKTDLRFAYVIPNFTRIRRRLWCGGRISPFPYWFFVLSFQLKTLRSLVKIHTTADNSIKVLKDVEDSLRISVCIFHLNLFLYCLSL